MLQYLRELPAEPFTEIQDLEIKKLLQIPLLRQFLAVELYQALETKAQLKLDPSKPVEFVQAEAYAHGKADAAEYLLNFPNT